MGLYKILLVNPNRMRPPIAPIGIEYVAADLQRRGYEVRPCDLTLAEHWRDALEMELRGFAPDVIGVSVRNLDDAYFASQDFVLELTAGIVGAIRELTSAPVVLGGIGFSIAPEEVMAYTGAPYGIVGDGEGAFAGLIEAIRAGREPSEVPGAVFRDESGRACVVSPSWSDISGLATPGRRWVDNVRYFAEGGQVGIETKRGCNQTCLYCVEPHAKGPRIRPRAPESVVEEITDLLDQAIDVFHLCDSEFNLPADHAYAICEAIRRHGLGRRIRWYAYGSPVPFDRDLARAMAWAGCIGINFGVDHASAEMLTRLGRTYPPEVLRETADACRGAGLAVMFDMLLGGPGERRETLAEAIGAMRAIRPDRVGLSCGVRIYPHTRLAEMVRRQGPLASNPHLHGTIEGNECFLKPIFFVDSSLGLAIHRIVSGLVDGDPMFLHADPDQVDGNYNYNDNSVLAQAIRDGHRGAYWDILRRLDKTAP
ncbi:MAG TPA: B12-binding domain-containing radical SAM protein [Candidatus Hydrogenedentes bacterium]|nr:B12-binding domain-containing radical SAM protein [Candidatus Hydrogenedentota bacterium]HPG67978.1 B12-binding domain-containing radical SAM protein [Candidatus Hydrogenedentota bacterium]